MDSDVVQTGPNWRERVRELEATLAALRPQLIDAETQLADRLAAIGAFEYRLRARLESLSHRLDVLQEEIDALRAELRRYQDSLNGDDDLPVTARGEQGWRFSGEEAAASGSYRYHKTAETPRPVLAAEQQAALKQLYRQLARRFHPDLAVAEADRAYRTDLMMAINAAYAAGDLAALQRLASEPDTAPHAPRSDEELAAALQREVDHCRRRLAEIAAELATLEGHESARLLRRAERAAAEGRDLLAEYAADLRRRINEKLVERDVLETQLEEMEQEGVELSAEDLADIVYNLGLERADDDALLDSYRDWRPRERHDPWETNDADPDGVEDILDDVE
jgi:predicted  nucleic acid-binding Zn-ribbon protein